MTSELAVLLDGELVGAVRPGRERSCWFAYSHDYTSGRRRVPLSLTMPVASGRYDIAKWLDGLLPPRLDAREQWAQRYGAASLDPIDMLATPIGWDCAGAVQFCPLETLPEMLARDSGTIELSEDQLSRHLEAVRLRRLDQAAPPQWAPFSLAGLQAKTALYRSSEIWALPIGSMPSTYILKVALPEFPDNDLVEHVCMSALRRAGVPAARTEIVQAAQERAIAIERYDRRRVDGASAVSTKRTCAKRLGSRRISNTKGALVPRPPT